MFFNNNGREDVTMKRAIAIGLVLTLLLSTETFGASQSSTGSESAVIETTAAAEEERTPVAGVEIPITDLEPESRSGYPRRRARIARKSAA